MKKRRRKQPSVEAIGLDNFIQGLKKSDTFRQSLVHHHYIPEVKASYSSPAGGLPLWLESALRAIGIEQLYAHQARAIEHVRAGRNVVLVTPTASGKSLAFNIPIIEMLVRDPDARALYLFPLKALEQDQLVRLEELCSQVAGQGDVSAAIYDGDTPRAERQKIRTALPRILITNPDMLHHGIMPYHTQWEKLFRSLKYIVIDELHTYRGVFGSHILQIFRRIRRLSTFYGSEVHFIAASATIENPRELAEALLDDEFEVVSESGAPAKAKHFLFFNPSHSPYTEAARLVSTCIEAGLKTIAFTRSRKITELLYSWCLEGNPGLRSKISAYRAGFLPEERRQIESELFAGRLDGVISTSALEMGIDIGGLDACILVGYPGTITATWQRGGRVGRKDREALIILIAGPDALDQYFVLNPQNFFERPCERAVVDADNGEIISSHLVCAAAEVPLRSDDKVFDTKRYQQELADLVSAGKLEQGAKGKIWFATKTMPHRDMDLRAMGQSFSIMTPDTKIIGQVSGRQRYVECHPGAIYLHRGNQYFIEDVDESKREILARSVDFDYYTVAVSDKETEILEVHCSKQVSHFTVNRGRLKVTETIKGFQRKRILGQILIDQVPLSYPPLTFETVGIWVEIEEEFRQFLEEHGRHYMGSLHGIEHAALSLFPLFALCDRNDVGGVCMPNHPQVKKGVIFMYDGHSGGVGLAARAYEVIDQLLERTLKLIEFCPCEEGCPSCIHSPKCGSGNKPLDKGGSIVALKLLLDHEIEAKYLEQTAGFDTLYLNYHGPEQNDNDKGPVSVVSTEALVAPVVPGKTWLEEQKRVLVFDLETQKSSHDVGGWNNAHLMRVSVAVIYDSQLDDYIEYFEENVDELIDHLRSGDLVVGYNSISFDYTVLKGYSSFNFAELPSFDLCREVHHVLGSRTSLNQLAEATLKSEKSADGLQALEWFKQGKIDLIARYCRKDVEITRDIFRFGLINHYLLVRKKKTDQIIHIPLDWDTQLKQKLNVDDHGPA